MSDNQLEALSADVLALEAVVRALVRLEARRSPGALADLIDTMTVEAERLAETIAIEKDLEPGEIHPSCAVLAAYIEHVKEDGTAKHQSAEAAAD